MYESPLVVVNADAYSTFLDLVGEEYLEAKFVQYIKNIRMSPSVFMVFLGVDMDLSEYPILIHHLDEQYEIVIGSNADPSLAPLHTASVTLLTGTYRQQKEAYPEEFIRKAKTVIPGLSDHILMQEAATPRTLNRYTGMPTGALYAFDQSLDTKRPYLKTPIKGLYLVGASTFLGGSHFRTHLRERHFALENTKYDTNPYEGG